MLDGQISLLTYHAGIHFATGGVPARRGNQHPSISPYETYRASDGFVNIAVGNDAQWRALCRAVGAPLAALADDARFATNAARVERRAELAAILEPVGRRAQPSTTGSRSCDGAGIPCGPILDVAAGAGPPAGAGARHGGAAGASDRRRHPRHRRPGRACRRRPAPSARRRRGSASIRAPSSPRSSAWTMRGESIAVVGEGAAESGCKVASGGPTGRALERPNASS